jgi:hypothetical protein
LGEYRPENGVFELSQNRARAFAEHSADFEWLYAHLCDWRSKRILNNILCYWLLSERNRIAKISDSYFASISTLT